MKLHATTVEHMAALIRPADTAARRAVYRAGDFPRAAAVRDLDKRYRWDLLWVTGAHPGYDDGVTDVHVDTALRSIVPPLAVLEADPSTPSSTEVPA